MSLFIAAIGLLGLQFSRLGASRGHAAAPAPPGGNTPTYYILGF